MSQFKIYIDYDEDPDIGGQQGVFFPEGGHTHGFSDIIGAKIVSAEFPDEEMPNALGAPGRVMVITLEKPDV